MRYTDGMLFEIENIKSALSSHNPVRHPIGQNTRRAAVAAILKPEIDHTQALFILRASKEGDPWSGQMAFPGGHIEETDESSIAAAIRETEEEIGLDLRAHGTYLGALDEVKANPRRRKIDMVVSPHVFLLDNPEVEFSPNYEVADVLWGSLDDMYHGRVETETEFAMNDVVQSFPGYAVGDQVVWGLTMRMLDHVFTLLDPAWESRAD